MQSDCDSLDDKHLVLCLYLPHHVCIEAIFVEGNLTRCQRAFESAEQSAARSCNYVIEGAGIRLLLVGGGTIVLSYLAVDPEENWFVLPGDIRPPDLTLDWLHLYLRDVSYIGHLLLL
jgi:hypothetical protein